MVGVQFKAVGNTDGTIDLQEVLKPDGLTSFDWDAFTEGDSVLIWVTVAQGYKETYFWAGTADTTDALGYDISNTWFDMGTYESADKEVAPGSAVWVKTASTGTATVTLAGEVTADDTKEVTITGNGFTMVANPFPSDLDINEDMTVTGLVSFDWDAFTEGDSLLIWDPTAQGYKETYFWAGTADTTAALGYDLSNTWFDMGTYESATKKVPAGGAFWIKTSGAGGKLTFKNPAK